MNSYNLFLNTWPWGTNLKVRAHIIDEFGHVKATVLYTQVVSGDNLPENISLPITLIRKYGDIVEMGTIFNNKKQILKIEVDKFLSRERVA